MIFIKDNYICDIKKDAFEPLEIFIERGNFIATQKPKNIDEYNEAVKYSRIYANCKFKNCQYSDTVMKKLKKYKKNVYIKS